MTPILRPRPSRSSTAPVTGARAATVVASALAVAVALVVTTTSAVRADGHLPWQWPLRPAPSVERGFEAPADPWGPGHRGIDLAGHVGQAVLAVAAGTVTFAGHVGGRGVVAVRHGAVRSTYQPLLPTVRSGDQVHAGDMLGRLTVVGSHCLPAVCLHLGAREGKDYLDPLSLLGSVDIRLKPLQASRGGDATAAGGTGMATVVPSSNPPPGALLSGARVGLTIGVAEPLGRDVRVDLGGGKRRVAQQLLHRPEVSSTFEKMRGRRVP